VDVVLGRDGPPPRVEEDEGLPAPLGAILDDEAPLTAALSRRVAAEPALAALAERAREEWGEAWCGGKIERSLRKVLKSTD
jgi:glutathione S-transferase